MCTSKSLLCYFTEVRTTYTKMEENRILSPFWIPDKLSPGEGSGWVVLCSGKERHLMVLPAIDCSYAAKSLQSCPTLCDPIDGSPPGSPVPGILQARTLEWVAIFFSNAWKWKVKVKSLMTIFFCVKDWQTGKNSYKLMQFLYYPSYYLINPHK